MINFNIPPYVGTELNYMKQAIENEKICGDGPFTKKCHTFFEERLNSKVLLTTSCTSALEMSALLCDIQEGDEVIMPSFTFVSTADAFVMRKGVPVFVDIRKDTMNIDENKIEEAITEKTKAICVVHYAGVSCEMDKINEIAKKYNLKVVEDAAQGVNSFYKGKPLGTLSDLGCFSFHETKNYSMGEGGALIINNNNFYDDACIIREKGTDRTKFIKGQVDKYTWLKAGSSYLPSDLLAAYLFAQLEKFEEINNSRIKAWTHYFNLLSDLNTSGHIELPFIPDNCTHNAHMFYIKTRNIDERSELIAFLRDNGIQSVFHYIPLHSAPAGKELGRFHGIDEYTTVESERLLRLPLYYNIHLETVEKVSSVIHSFYLGRNTYEKI